MQNDAVSPVSADVVFASTRFPKYKIGANNQIVEVKEDTKMLSHKEMVARETALLLEQQQRLSVRDLASKFEKGSAAAAKLSDEARLKEAASLEKHVLLKKLRDALEALRGRVGGKNKDDVEEAIAMIEALAVQLTQREGELIQEKAEVKKLATFLKQASEDAKKLVDEERAFARAEIENARAAVQRVEEALQDHERISRASGKQDLDELMKEVQEARRIKMLHQPSRVVTPATYILFKFVANVMDMENELQALRTQLAEKSKRSVQLQKELAMNKKGDKNKPHLYEIDGTEALGSYLRIYPCSDVAPDLQIALFSGATKSEYAPEPFDVGRILQADILTDDQTITITTSAPIDPAAGLGNYVEALVRRHDTEFTLCGIRGGGNAAAQSVYWQAKTGLSFILAFESERERNAAIMLAFAFDCNIMLAGPDDRSAAGT
ncbi:UNVERIFIED_CONTAM: Stomatal closure-related actin-binding protein 1 [Sesamum radiatum]|uniref:Stomatal closure-related actin-binding protein 1 n=1 Tax=Sesamum radiatum TaxID=300843 RepID=A0AAW2W8U5_SESRA